MPLPKPRKNQTQEEFHSACMSSEVMKRDFKDTKQRNAVCYNLWKTAKKNAKAGEEPSFDDIENSPAYLME
jgi:hypothetical protein